MTLIEKINKDYVEAFKSKNAVAKSALSSVKAKVIEFEKSGSAKSGANDDDVLKIVISVIKQRKQSIEEFKKAGRQDLVDAESQELSVIEEYLPKQMSDSEISENAQIIIYEIKETPGINAQALAGKSMGAFNKKFPGMADPKKVKEIIENLLK